jgi:hypothetical protein
MEGHTFFIQCENQPHDSFYATQDSARLLLYKQLSLWADMLLIMQLHSASNEHSDSADSDVTSVTKTESEMQWEENEFCAQADADIIRLNTS